MKIEIKTYQCLCELEEFKINGINASYTDFGNKYDLEPALADAYCCYNMKFVAKLPTQEVLDKYKIGVDEYNKVCEELDCLSFGCCCLCN